MSLKLRQHISRVKTLGGSDIKQSDRKHKKYAVKVDDKWIHFGSDKHEDYLMHNDNKRRENYKKRHKAIKLKDGTPAYKNKMQPAYWSMRFAWS